MSDRTTSGGSRRRALVSVGVLAIAVSVLSYLLIRSFATGQPRATELDIPSDVARLGITLEAANLAGAITHNQAITTIQASAGDLGPDVVAAAYLVEVTDPHTLGTDRPVDHRRVWLVRLTGFSLFKPGPQLEDGTSAPGHTAHFLYAYVDAESGEILDAQYWE